MATYVALPTNPNSSSPPPRLWTCAGDTAHLQWPARFSAGPWLCPLARRGRRGQARRLARTVWSWMGRRCRFWVQVRPDHVACCASGRCQEERPGTTAAACTPD